jgi:hypothetical protein
MNKRKILVLLSVLFSFGYAFSGHGSFLGRKRKDSKSEVSVVFNVSPQAHGGQVTQHVAQPAALGRDRRNRLETLLIRDALSRRTRESSRELVQLRERDRDRGDVLTKLIAQCAALQAENLSLKGQIADAIREKRDRVLRMTGCRDALEQFIEGR